LDKRPREHPCVTALVLVARFSGFKDEPWANALGNRDVRILWCSCCYLLGLVPC
jgi:hypothetical protein